MTHSHIVLLANRHRGPFNELRGAFLTYDEITNMTVAETRIGIRALDGGGAEMATTWTEGPSRSANGKQKQDRGTQD
jgi:hypothetical protein